MSHYVQTFLQDIEKPEALAYDAFGEDYRRS